MNLQEAQASWSADRQALENAGIYLHGVNTYTPDGWGRNFGMALDALPTPVTDPNSAIPAMLTTMIDPTVIKVLFTPNKAAKIADEERKGSWLDEVAMFPIVEHTGEVSSYGDYNTNGRTGVNTNFPQRQSYLFQTMKEYGERELERAGLAKIDWVSQIDIAAATVLDKFMNLTYFFGVQGLQNYGLLNDPNLPASITPAPKAYGNSKWITNGIVTASANEIYADFEALFIQLVSQSGGLIEAEDELTVAMSPGSQAALLATNAYNVNVGDLLKKNFPNIKIETAVQYGALSATNPQGVAAGNLVQMIAKNVEGQKTLSCFFSEKMRTHKLVPAHSSWSQKITAGTWGCVIRQPFAIASMIGV